MPHNRCSSAATLFFWLIAVLTMHTIRPLAVIADSTVPCDIQRGPCTAKTDDMIITFDILPKPVRTLSELRFMVTVKKNELPVTDTLVALDLSMPGMYMGRNRPALKHLCRGTYQGTGIIPPCTSGRKSWQAQVTVGRGMSAAIARFHFEVK